MMKYLNCERFKAIDPIALQSQKPYPCINPELGNRSPLFARKEHSWHGVREIRCPEGHMRKVFIVV
jgi:hypothetical protein